VVVFISMAVSVSTSPVTESKSFNIKLAVTIKSASIALTFKTDTFMRGVTSWEAFNTEKFPVELFIIGTRSKFKSEKLPTEALTVIAVISSNPPKLSVSAVSVPLMLTLLDILTALQVLTPVVVIEKTFSTPK